MGDLCYIFVADQVLLDINKEFMKHDYFTDIITFNYNNNKTVNGEIYISIETVYRNSKKYGVSFKNELLRVMVHGVLHLIGTMIRMKPKKRMRGGGYLDKGLFGKAWKN